MTRPTIGPRMAYMDTRVVPVEAAARWVRTPIRQRGIPRRLASSWIAHGVLAVHKP